MIFTRGNVNLLKSDGSEVNLNVYGKSVFSYKYLGLIFDPWLTWGLHINYLVERCQNPLSVLQSVAHKNWGADRNSWFLPSCSSIKVGI